MTTPARAMGWAGAAALALATANALPAISTLTPLRSRLLPRLSGVGYAGHVALTFDDGPDPASTPRFLTALDQLGVRATFFVLGSMLEQNPGLGRRLAAEGHQVAVHGWHHRNAFRRTPRMAYDEMARTRDLVTAVTGTVPTLYRPPYGVLSVIDLVAARQLSLQPVLWTAWARDWSHRTTPDQALRIVSRTLTGGGTVLLHDCDCAAAPGAWRTTLALLPRLVARCRAEGLAIGPLREHGAWR